MRVIRVLTDNKSDEHILDFDVSQTDKLKYLLDCDKLKCIAKPIIDGVPHAIYSDHLAHIHLSDEFTSVWWEDCVVGPLVITGYDEDTDLPISTGLSTDYVNENVTFVGINFDAHKI